MDSCVSKFEAEIEQLILDEGHLVETEDYWWTQMLQGLVVIKVPTRWKEDVKTLTQVDWLMCSSRRMGARVMDSRRNFESLVAED